MTYTKFVGVQVISIPRFPSPREEMTPSLALEHSINFIQKLMAPPAAPQVSGRGMQASVGIPRSTHCLFVRSTVNALFTWLMLCALTNCHLSLVCLYCCFLNMFELFVQSSQSLFEVTLKNITFILSLIEPNCVIIGGNLYRHYQLIYSTNVTFPETYGTELILVDPSLKIKPAVLSKLQ